MVQEILLNVTAILRQSRHINHKRAAILSKQKFYITTKNCRLQLIIIKVSSFVPKRRSSKIFKCMQMTLFVRNRLFYLKFNMIKKKKKKTTDKLHLR